MIKQKGLLSTKQFEMVNSASVKNLGSKNSFELKLEFNQYDNVKFTAATWKYS